MKGAGLNAKGFTLMEIMVSVLVLAIALTVIMQLLAGGLRSEKLSEDYLKAVVCARSGMESIMLKKALAAKTLTGTCEGGYHWQAVITLDADLGKEPSWSDQVPFRIDLEVPWQSGRAARSFRLASLQLAPVEQEGGRAQ